MALIVEDGTGKADAQSYASVADADAWHTARGITTWTSLLAAEKEQALVRATAHMVQTYRFRWAGRRRTTTQALDWPRYEVQQRDLGVYSMAYYAEDVVPVEVRDACAELAFHAAAGDLNPAIGRLTKSEKIGDLAVEYQTHAAPGTRRPSIDAMLSPFLVGRAGVLLAVRA